ncbi:unnamed protein product [Rhodiola kirilowii]
MPPKFDPSQVIDVFIRVTGGEVGARLIPFPRTEDRSVRSLPEEDKEDITKETAKDWKCLRVTVKLTVQNQG